ncbi:MAG: type 4a pilus biogenesis protein PilO [Gaiellaceae bacterium]
MKRKKRDPKVFAAVAAGILGVAVFGYLVVVSPQRSRAAELSDEIVATQTQIDAARVESRKRPVSPRVDDLFRVAKAMPDQIDMPGLLLELSRVAGETGITFESITPGPAAPVTTFQSQPVELAFKGTFYELSDFLFRLRNLVSRRGGTLDVGGRLYAVDTIDFTQSENGSQLEAKLTAKAFVYGGGTSTPASPATAAAPPPTPAPAASS